MLTNTAVVKAKPQEKVYVLPDADGLGLVIYPSGRRCWQVRYWQAKKEVRKVIGEYPVMSLAEARQARDAIKLRVRIGAPVDGSVTFGQMAEEWYKVRQAPRFKEGHLETVRQKLDQYVLPLIGTRSMSAITRLELTDLLSRMVAKSIVESAHRTAGIIRMVFDYAVDKGVLPPDGALVAADLVRILPPRPHEHFASVKREEDVLSGAEALEMCSCPFAQSQESSQTLRSYAISRGTGADRCEACTTSMYGDRRSGDSFLSVHGD